MTLTERIIPAPPSVLRFLGVGVVPLFAFSAAPLATCGVGMGEPMEREEKAVADTLRPTLP